MEDLKYRMDVNMWTYCTWYFLENFFDHGIRMIAGASGFGAFRMAGSAPGHPVWGTQHHCNFRLVGGLEHFLFFSIVVHSIWDNPSHWLIFFRGVKSTNQFRSRHVMFASLQNARGRHMAFRSRERPEGSRGHCGVAEWWRNRAWRVGAKAAKDWFFRWILKPNGNTVGKSIVLNSFDMSWIWNCLQVPGVCSSNQV